MELKFDCIDLKEWKKFHKFLQKEEDKIKKPITEKEFTSPGNSIIIIQNKKPIVTVLRKGKINEIRGISVPEYLKDKKEISIKKLEFAKKVYLNLKEKWRIQDVGKSNI